MLKFKTLINQNITNLYLFLLVLKMNSYKIVSYFLNLTKICLNSKTNFDKKLLVFKNYNRNNLRKTLYHI